MTVILTFMPKAKFHVVMTCNVQKTSPYKYHFLKDMSIWNFVEFDFNYDLCFLNIIAQHGLILKPIFNI